MSSEPKPTTKPRRRFWPRFTLRVLLVLVTAICIGLGWWTHRAREQRLIVEGLRSQPGGNWDYAYRYHDGEYHSLEQSRVPEWLLKRLGSDYFHGISSIKSHDKVVVAALHKLPRLEAFYLFCNGTTDDDVNQVCKSRGLRTIMLFPDDAAKSTAITDRSLARLGQMPRLESLYIYGTQLSPSGIAELAKGPALRDVLIWPAEDNLDAAALEPFKRSPSIEHVRIVRYGIGVKGPQTVAEWKPE